MNKNLGFSLVFIRLKMRSDSQKTVSNIQLADGKPANPRKTANLLSILFFGWTIPIFKRTYDKILRPNDVFEPLSADLSNVLGDRLDRSISLKSSKIAFCLL